MKNLANSNESFIIDIFIEWGLHVTSLVFYHFSWIKAYTMMPNDLYFYNMYAEVYSTANVQPQKYLSWSEGMFVFRNDPLDVISKT
jgi:hypothetical protein